jgi:hypothetical protein
MLIELSWLDKCTSSAITSKSALLFLRTLDDRGIGLVVSFLLTLTFKVVFFTNELHSAGEYLA